MPDPVHAMHGFTFVSLPGGYIAAAESHACLFL